MKPTLSQFITNRDGYKKYLLATCLFKSPKSQHGKLILNLYLDNLVTSKLSGNKPPKKRGQ